jgi:hypothetical protein
VLHTLSLCLWHGLRQSLLYAGYEQVIEELHGRMVSWVSLHLVTAASRRSTCSLRKALDALRMLNYHRMRCCGASRRISLFSVRRRCCPAHAHAQGSPEAPQAYHQRRSTAQGMPMPVSAASRSGGTSTCAHSRASGALGPDVTGAAEERGR